MKIKFWIVAVALAFSGVVGAENKHPFGFEDMAKMYRVSNPRPSPNGEWVVFSADLPDLAKNKVEKDVWLVSFSGGSVKKLTKEGVQDYGAMWLNDHEVIYVSVRGGTAQVFKLNPFTKKEVQLTKFPTDVDLLGTSPDNKNLLLGIAVYPDCADLVCTAKKDKEKEDNPVKAYIYDELLFRHWDSWDDGKKNHLFLFPLAGGSPVDITKGFTSDSPTKPWGGAEEVAFSPDGKELALTAKVEPNPAIHTNHDIFIVNLSDLTRKCITCENKATDTSPAYSPDGRYIAYLAMKRPGYESDRYRIELYDRTTRGKKTLAEDWDVSPSTIAWGADSKNIFVTATHRGHQAAFSVGVATGKPAAIFDKHYINSPVVTKDRLFFTRDGYTNPAEVFSSKLDGSDLRVVTDLNKATLANAIFSEPEEFWFKGAGGDQIHGWFFKPVGYKEGDSYPLAYFIHGGPQGSWEDHFHYRWNMEVAAGEGFAVAAVDFHGSTGYGQTFTDSIRGNWGSRPYKDLMMGLDHVLEKYPWIDSDRVCALGASFGGYMINWIEGNTDRFACLINHDGDFSTFAAYYNTEELWFPEWDMGGTAYDNPRNYEKWSPDRLVKNWKTPMLVIHGAKDYRVVDTEGMSTFTALRRRGVPAKFIYFPNANHWVLKPADSRLWHKEVYDWLKRWTKKS